MTAYKLTDLEKGGKVNVREILLNAYSHLLV